MKSKFFKSAILFLFIFCFSCSPRINYLGNYYSPTENVSLHFDKNDIQEKYSVIGFVNFKIEPLIFSNDKNYISNLLINKAKEVGADGVLVTKFSNEINNSLVEDISSKQVVSSESENILIEAKFLKFKE